MIYKNIPHITLDGLNEVIGENKFIYCIIEEKIDGAPIIIGKEDDRMYIQTGRSDKIYSFFTDQFYNYTKNKTDNPIRLKRAYGYDRSVYIIMDNHLSFFEKHLSNGDWIRYEMLSRLLTGDGDMVKINGADSLQTSIIHEINMGGEFKPHIKINEDINNSYELVGIKYVNVVYPSVRFSSLVNLVEVDRSFNPLYKLRYINDSQVSFYKNKQLSFKLPDEKESFLEFIQRFQILDELGVMSEGLIFKFFGTSEIKTYKLTTNYFKYLRQQK